MLYFWIRCSLRESGVDELYTQDLPLMPSRPTGIFSTCFSPLTLRDLTTVLGSLTSVLNLMMERFLSFNFLTDLKQQNGLTKSFLNTWLREFICPEHRYVVQKNGCKHIGALFSITPTPIPLQ